MRTKTTCSAKFSLTTMYSIVSDNVGAFKYTGAQPCALTQHELNTKFASKRCTPKELAGVITDFISALRECHGPPTESSLLFGEHARSRYTCVGDGLLVAWLMHLETEDTLPNYEETRNLLQHIGFDKCTWDLLAWNNGPGQPQRKPMKVTTRNTLYQLFESRIPAQEIWASSSLERTFMDTSRIRSPIKTVILWKNPFTPSPLTRSASKT